MTDVSLSQILASMCEGGGGKGAGIAEAVYGEGAVVNMLTKNSETKT